jgi:hypothetical protein
VASWGSYSYVYGPAVAFFAVALLVLLLRWTFRRGSSVVERRPRRGTASDYGLLVPVAAPPTFAEAELIRARLVGQGIRATLAPTSATTSATTLRVSCPTSLRICSIAGVPALEEAIPRPTGQYSGV